MQFSSFILAAGVFALAHARPELTNTAPEWDSVTAGQTFNLTWAEADGPVTLTLMDGTPPNSLKAVSPIASSLTGSYYVWNVPTTLVSNEYVVEIDDSTGDPNYGPQFELVGGVPSSAATTSSSGPGTTASATTASSTTTSSNSAAAATTSSISSPSSTSSASSSSISSATGTNTSTSTPSPSATSVHSAGSPGLSSSPLAFVFLAVAAILTLH